MANERRQRRGNKRFSLKQNNRLLGGSAAHKEDEFAGNKEIKLSLPRGYHHDHHHGHHDHHDRWWDSLLLPLYPPDSHSVCGSLIVQGPPNLFMADSPCSPRKETDPPRDPLGGGGLEWFLSMGPNNKSPSTPQVCSCKKNRTEESLER